MNDTTRERPERAAPKPAGWVIHYGRKPLREGGFTSSSLERHALFATAADAWRAVDSAYGLRARRFWMERGYRVQRATWREREAIRFESGGYVAPVWRGERWWREALIYRSEIRDHYAHVSTEAPGMVAFTASEEKGERDIQTRMKAGRYLKQFFGDQLTDKQISYFAEWQRRGQRPEIDWIAKAELCFATTPDEIVNVYERGPTSCMHGDDCVGVYGAGDLAVAYLTRPDGGGGPEIIARALVWPEKKALGRIYPNVDSWSDDGFASEDESTGARDELERRLKADGYVSFYEKGDVFDGARILAEQHNDGGWTMPYIDKLAASGPHKGSDGRQYFTLSQYGDFTPDRTDGRFFTAWGYCENCSEGIDCADDAYTVYSRYDGRRAVHAESWCQCCYEDSSFYCEATDLNYDATDEGSVEVQTSRHGSQTWARGYAYAGAGHAFEYEGETIAKAVESERFPGFPAWLDTDSEVHPELLAEAGDPDNLPNLPQPAQSALALEPESEVAF